MDQTNRLVGLSLRLAVIALNILNAVAFMDILGISSVLSPIAEDFGAQATITWASTSQLVAATVGQCLLGYLSDMFGRKPMLLTAALILCLSALGCGLSHFAGSAALFYVFRACAGLGTGGISNLVNIAQNDFLTQEQRAQYQGYQGISVALGQATGLIVGAAFGQMNAKSRFGWPCLYYIESALALSALIVVYFAMPASKRQENRPCVSSGLRMIDWYGIVSGAIAVVTVLIATTEGDKFGWTSHTTIMLFVSAGLCASTFLVLGLTNFYQRCGVRPIVPFRLFRNSTIRVIMLQNICFGMAFYSFTVFMPMYWRTVKGKSLLTAAALLLPYVGTHGVWSAISPRIMKWLSNEQTPPAKGYKWMAAFGFACWMTAMFTIGFTEGKLHIVLLVFLEVLVGFGSGSVFQNSVNAIRSQVTAEDQAVAIGSRNVIRFLGGALGTALADTIFKMVFRRALPLTLRELAGQTFGQLKGHKLAAMDSLAIDLAQRKAIKMVFTFGGCAIGVCFVLCFFIRTNSNEQPKSTASSSSCSQQDVEMQAIPAANSSENGTDESEPDKRRDSASLRGLQIV